MLSDNPVEIFSKMNELKKNTSLREVKQSEVVPLNPPKQKEESILDDFDFNSSPHLFINWWGELFYY